MLCAVCAVTIALGIFHFIDRGQIHRPHIPLSCRYLSENQLFGSLPLEWGSAGGFSALSILWVTLTFYMSWRLLSPQTVGGMTWRCVGVVSGVQIFEQISITSDLKWWRLQNVSHHTFVMPVSCDIFKVMCYVGLCKVWWRKSWHSTGSNDFHTMQLEE